MSDTPDREPETGPIADSTTADPNPPAPPATGPQGPPPGPRGAGPRPDCPPPPPHRDNKPNRLYQIAAWVAIIAGTLFIVCVIFFAGVMVGHSSDGRHEHRGHGNSMFKGDDRGPTCLMMKNRMGPGDADDDAPRRRPGGSDDSDSPRRAPSSPTTEPARPPNP